MLVSSQKLNINSSEIIPGENPGSPQVSPAVKELNRLYYGSNMGLLPTPTSKY